MALGNAISLGITCPPQVFLRQLHSHWVGPMPWEGKRRSYTCNRLSNLSKKLLLSTPKALDLCVLRSKLPPWGASTMYHTRVSLEYKLPLENFRALMP